MNVEFQIKKTAIGLVGLGKKILLDRRYDEPLSIYSRFVGMTIK